MAHPTLYNVFTQLLYLPEPKVLKSDQGAWGTPIMVSVESQAFSLLNVITDLRFKCYRFQPKWKQNDDKKYQGQTGYFLKGQIFNIDQLFYGLNHELAGIDMAGRPFGLEIRFKVGQGADGAGQLHNDHDHKG